MLIPLIITAKDPARGFIAGRPPAGLVTLNDAPGRAEVDLFVRETRQWIRSTRSEFDGRYEFEGLTLGVEYDVIGRDYTRTWQDVIVGAVQPWPYGT